APASRPRSHARNRRGIEVGSCDRGWRGWPADRLSGKELGRRRGVRGGNASQGRRSHRTENQSSPVEHPITWLGYVCVASAALAIAILARHLIKRPPLTFH